MCEKREYCAILLTEDKSMRDGVCGNSPQGELKKMHYGTNPNLNWDYKTFSFLNFGYKRIEFSRERMIYRTGEGARNITGILTLREKQIFKNFDFAQFFFNLPICSHCLAVEMKLSLYLLLLMFFFGKYFCVLSFVTWNIWNDTTMQIWKTK